MTRLGMQQTSGLAFAALAWSVLAWYAPGRPAVAQEPAAERTAPDATLKYRRVFAPADRVQDWPRGAARYVPVAPEEFERLVERIRDVPDAATASPAARTLRAVYQARFDGQATLVGQATLEIGHSGDAPAAMALEPCGLAIGACSWQTPQGRPATVGVRDDGKLAVLVTAADQLSMDWSLRGRREMAGPIAFQFQLPVCPASTLLLDLPEDSVPIADKGIVVDKSGAGAGRVKWRIELGGLNRFSLRLAPRESGNGQPRPVQFRETTTYDLSGSGVDVSAQWKLDVHGEPLRRLEIELEAGLRLVTARYGDGDVAWSIVEGGDADASRLVLEFPEPILGVDRVLRLAAIAPLTVDKSWRLPRIRPQGVMWREGSVALLVRSPLTMDDLVPSSCRQTRTGPLPAPAEGESIELQCFGPEAAVQVALRRERKPQQISSGTTIRLGSGAAVAEMLAELRSPDAGRFLLEADVPREWSIDTVQTTPREALGDWRLDATDAAAGVLHVRLARPLNSDSTVKLRVRGRRSLSGADPAVAAVALADLEMLSFRGTTSPLRLMALATDESHQLQLADAKDVLRTSADRLTPYEQALLADEENADYILRLSAVPPRGHATIEDEQPRYTADVRVLATASAGRLTESYSLRCTPATKQISRVLVRFTPSREAPVQWAIGEEAAGQLFARCVGNHDDPTAKGDPASETWEVTLIRPRSTPFELRATRSTSRTAELPLALAHLPEAADQQAQVVVAAAPDVPLDIRNRGLKQVELDPVAAGRYATARAAFRYEPSDTAAELRLAPATGLAAQQTAWAWSCETDSRLETDGRIMHSIAYRIENRGRRRVSIQPPPGFDVTGVWVDRTRLESRLDNGSIVCDLLPDKAFVTLVLQGESAGPPLGWCTRFEAPHVELDVPVLARRCRVWIPPGYEALLSSGMSGGFRSLRLSWSQRLFGPLGRAAGSPPFDPLDASDWRRVSGGEEDLKAAESRARDLAQRLTESAATGPRGAGAGEIDWGELLLRSQNAADSALSLLMDWQALGEAGIGPRTAAPKLPTQREADDAGSLLAHARLRLLIHGDVAVLTTDTAAAAQRRELDAMELDTLHYILPGPLAEEVRAAAAGSSDRYVPLQRWDAVAKIAWTESPSSAAPWMDDAAWEAVVIEPAADGTLRITVVRQSLVPSARWSIFLLVVAFSWWALRERGVALIAMTGAFAALALALPDALAPLATGGVLGSILSLAVTRWLPRKNEEAARSATERSSNSGSRMIRATQTAILFVTGGLIATSALQGRAQEPPTEEPKAPRGDVHRVFIPVDDKNNPTGGKYQVPEAFYGELRRRAAAATSEPQGWLLQSADYRATLARDVLLRRAMLKDLSASFELQVFTDGTRVRLPLGREGIELAPGGALLDGRAIALERDADGKTFSLEVAEAGPHRLELSLRADVRTTGDTSTLDLHIPPLANSTLELVLPADPPEVELPEALGNWSLAPDKQKLTAQLGPASRLVIRWSQRAAGPDTAAAVDVDELLWMQVQPGAVVVQGKFKFKVRSGAVRQLQFAVDPHLRLLPLEARDSPLALVETLPGDPQTVRVELSRAVADQVTVPLKFLVTGASGVGALGVPRLEALSARGTRRWLAVSVDPSLEFQVENPAGENALTVPDFVAQWGLVASSPQLAFRAPKNEFGWRLTTRPREQRISARQSLAIGARHGRLTVDFDARLAPADAQPSSAGGDRFRHRLHAPAELQVDGVSVLEEGVQRVARWARAPQGDIVVFLAAPAAAQQQLSLRGWLPTTESGRMPLPLVGLADAEIRETAVQVWRQPEVSVAVEDVVGLTEVNEPPRAEQAKELGRLVGSYLVQGEVAAATLAIAPNAPRVRADMVTRVSRAANGWEASVDYRCHVENGALDLLRFDVPSNWPGPYEFAPAATHEVVDVGDENRQQLIVRPRAAIQGDFRLSIRGPLRNGSGERLVAPNVVPAVAPSAGGETNRFFVLPARIGSEQLRWETSGLRLEALPTELADGASAPIDSFIVVGDAPTATLKAIESGDASARVRMADVRIAWQADGGYRGQSAFDLSVAGEASCRLRMPGDLDLVHLSVAGAPVTPLPIAENQWRVPLAADKLRQRIEIVFSSKSAAPSFAGQISLTAPSIEDWPVDQSRWTVYGPPDAGTGEGRIVAANTDSATDGATDSAMSSLPEESASVVDATLGCWRAATHVAAPSAVSQVSLTYSRGPARDRLWRIAAALLLLAATAWFVRSQHKMLALDCLARWPCAAGVIMGLAWWLWLTPSALGLAIAVVSVLAAIRDGLRSAGQRGATVAGAGIRGGV